MNFPEIYSATGMMELIQKIGFLPLLDSSIEGFSAEDIVAEKCHVCTESSSTRKQDSSVRNGGRTSVTTEEASSLAQMMTR